MHTVLGGDEGPECDYVWPCLLLDMYWRLGEGKARMPAVQTGVFGAARIAAAGMIDQMYNTMGCLMMTMTMLYTVHLHIIHYNTFSASSIRRSTLKALSPLVNMSSSSLLPFPSSVWT